MNLTNKIALLKKLHGESTEPWDEIWKPLPGVDGIEVSDQGQVRSFLKKGNHKEKKWTTYRILKQHTRQETGYKTVAIVRNGKHKTGRVHQLVALAFIGERPPGHQVAHLNGNPGDNRLVNLKYCTPKENNDHKKVHGTLLMGEQHQHTTLAGWQVAEIKFLAAKGINQAKIAALFDTDKHRVSQILREVVWKSVPARLDLPEILDELETALNHWEVDRGLARLRFEKVKELEAEVGRLRIALQEIIQLDGKFGCESVDIAKAAPGENK